MSFTIPTVKTAPKESTSFLPEVPEKFPKRKEIKRSYSSKIGARRTMNVGETPVKALISRRVPIEERIKMAASERVIPKSIPGVDQLKLRQGLHSDPHTIRQPLRSRRDPLTPELFNAAMRNIALPCGESPEKLPPKGPFEQHKLRNRQATLPEAKMKKNRILSHTAPRPVSMPLQDKNEKELRDQILLLTSEITKFEMEPTIAVVDKIKKLHSWYATLEKCSQRHASIEIKYEIAMLMAKLDYLGSRSIRPFHAKLQDDINDCVEAKKGSFYSLRSHSMICTLLKDYPRISHWIFSTNPEFIQMLVESFPDCFWGSYDHILGINEKKTLGRIDIQERIVQLLLDGRSACHSLHLLTSSPGANEILSWKTYEAAIFEKLSSHWHPAKDKDLGEAALIYPCEKLLEKACKKNSNEEKREKLALSFAITLVNLRLDTLSCFSTGDVNQLFLAEAENVKALLEKTVTFSEKISSFTTFSILSKNESYNRARLLELFIFAAFHCLGLGDLESASAIYRGLYHVSVIRLTKTFERLSHKTDAKFKKLNALYSMERNFAAYRAYYNERKLNVLLPNLVIMYKDLECAKAENKDTGKIFGELLARIVYAAKILHIYQKAVEEDIFPVPDLKAVFEEEKYKFMGSEDSLYTHSRKLE